jgi:hypothetical protein
LSFQQVTLIRGREFSAWRVNFRGRVNAQTARNDGAEKRKTVSTAPREFW